MTPDLSPMSPREGLKEWVVVTEPTEIEDKTDAIIEILAWEWDNGNLVEGARDARAAILSLLESYGDQRVRDYVEPHIKHCEESNGLSFCKNCQLTRPGGEDTGEPL